MTGKSKTLSVNNGRLNVNLRSTQIILLLNTLKGDPLEVAIVVISIVSFCGFFFHY